jgi:hypothetical protein
MEWSIDRLYAGFANDEVQFVGVERNVDFVQQSQAMGSRRRANRTLQWIVEQELRFAASQI